MIEKRKFKEIKRAIKYPVLFFLIRLFLFFVRFMKRNHILKICSGLGKVAFIIVKKQRLKTINNLKFIYGDIKTDKEIEILAREVFINQALNFADYVYTIRFTTRQQFSEIVDFVGEEHLEKAYKEGKGVLCLMCHVGSWEFSAIMPPVMGYETSAVSRALRNERIDHLIVKLREKRGMKNFARGNVYAQLVDVLKNGECLIIMIDQDTKVKGVFVDFLGKSAYTPIGAARLAMDTRAPVIPMYMKRLSNNKHQFTVLPALPFINTGNEEADLLENTRIYTRTIENIIKETPEQWVWMHDRWKTKPEDIEIFLQKKNKSK